jgi:hypothetical protein
MTILAILSFLTEKNYKINKIIKRFLDSNLEDAERMLILTHADEVAALFVLTNDQLLALPLKFDSVNWSNQTATDRYYLGPHMYDDFLRTIKYRIENYLRENAWEIPDDIDYKAYGFISLSDIKYNWDYFFRGDYDSTTTVWVWLEMQKQNFADRKARQRQEFAARQKREKQERKHEFAKWQSDRDEVRGMPSCKSPKKRWFLFWRK